jgi:glycosyltransferase involved in cell wall biosynthesis
MKVSAVLPVYNGEKYLRHAIESVFAQSYGAVELIAVDDGSTDRSLTVLKEYEDRIRLVIQENSGVSSARNRGVRQSNGELIAFIDQDDVWYKHKVHRQVEIFLTHPEVSFVYSDIDIIDASGRIIEKNGLQSWDLEWVRPFIRGYLHPFPSTVMMRKDLILEQQGFSTDFVGNSHEDVELWARVCRKTDLYFIEEALTQYRRDEQDRVERRIDPDYRLLNTVTLCNKLAELCGDEPETRRHLKKILEIEAQRQAKIGKALAREGKFVDARSQFRAAWGLYKRRKHLWRYMRTFLPSQWRRLLFPR